MAVAGDTSYVSSGLVEIISSDAILKMEQSGITRRLVRSEYRPNADQITIQVWNNGTNTATYADVSSVTDGTAVSATVINSDKKTITLAPLAIRSDLYDDTMYSNQDDPAGPLGGLLGQAMSDKIDFDLNALFDGFSQAVGTSTVGFTVDNLYKAKAYLEAASAEGQMYGVFHTNQIWGDYGLMNDIATSTQFGGSPDIQNEALRTGLVQMVGGIMIFKSNLIAEASNARKGGVFVRDALALGYAGPASMVKVERERQADYMRDIYVISSFYGVTECVDTWGVEVHTKTS